MGHMWMQTTTLSILQVFWDPNFWDVLGQGVQFPHTNKQFLDSLLVPKNSAQSWHYPPRHSVHRLRFQSHVTARMHAHAHAHTHTHSYFRSGLQAQIVTYASDWPTTDWRFPPPILLAVGILPKVYKHLNHDLFPEFLHSLFRVSWLKHIEHQIIKYIGLWLLELQTENFGKWDTMWTVGEG